MPEEMDEFDQGFELLDESDEEEAGKPESAAAAQNPAPAQNTAPVPQAGPARYEQPVYDPGPARLSEEPQAIAEELATLKKLNPNAYDLAMEDSAEGSSIRSRLENYGAEQAQDRAELVLFQRSQARERQAASRAAVDAHNQRFADVIREKAPDYFNLMNDPNRLPERERYIKNVFDWIGGKPYREAEKLMQIAQSGRDPDQICDLIKRYEREKKRPDPTGLYAAPGRSGRFAPQGLGDREDFDAGWDLNN